MSRWHGSILKQYGLDKTQQPYNKQWTCSITPRENRLKVAIRAGEKEFQKSLGIPGDFRGCAETLEEDKVGKTKRPIQSNAPLVGKSCDFMPRCGAFPLFEWWRLDLNQRPRAYESPALPLSYATRHVHYRKALYTKSNPAQVGLIFLGTQISA